MAIALQASVADRVSHVIKHAERTKDHWSFANSAETTVGGRLGRHILIRRAEAMSRDLANRGALAFKAERRSKHTKLRRRHNSKDVPENLDEL